MIRDDLAEVNRQELSLRDIEEVYIGLMKSYSACLSNLVIRRWRWPIADEFVHTIVRWRTKKRIDMMRATLFLLIAAIEIDERTAKKNLVDNFINYCEDMERFSNQISLSGYMTIIYGSIPPFVLGLPLAFSKEFGDIISSDKILYLLTISIILYVLFIIRGFWYSSKSFYETGVSEKDKEFYNLIYAYSSR